VVLKEIKNFNGHAEKQKHNTKASYSAMIAKLARPPINLICRDPFNSTLALLLELH
jgi:hypothetical protein